jgi:hypothetical protein
MTMPRVTEVQVALEPVSQDSFIKHLEETVLRDDGAPLGPAVAPGEAPRHED